MTRATINRIINGKAWVTPKMAMRLVKWTGSTPVLWIHAQLSVDLWRETQVHQGDWAGIRPLDKTAGEGR